MKAYKGFSKDMTCRGFKFEEGKEYHEEKAELCNTGFHACENPIDCFGYYAPGNSIYRTVELDGVSGKKDSDSKQVGTTIKIGAQLNVRDICRLTFEYVKEHCTNENNAEPGKPATAGDSGAATAGDRGAATAGYSGAATAGDRGAATAGDYGAATAGDCGAATAGDRGAATAGDRGAATAGDYGAATAGDCGISSSRGSSASGTNGLSVARGKGVRCKGGLGALLVIAIEDDTYNIMDYKAVIVDGVNVKADTWYTLEDGKLK